MFYTHGSLDRADPVRKDDNALRELLSAGTTRWIPVWEGTIAVTRQPVSAEPRMIWLPSNSAAMHADPLFLGFVDGLAHFAIDCAELDEPARAALLAQAEGPEGPVLDAEFSDLRLTGPLLPANEGALLAYARGMIYWQKTARFCERCGARLISHQGGHVRRCSNSDCGNQAFPRTDPAVIMLVTHQATPDGEPRCLLGGAPAWPSGVFSTLAGFVEPGESLEQAVQREVFEEAGIETTDVQYVASQPWPFPRSIMLGFQARATTTDIVIDPNELARADWFTRDELASFGLWGDETSARQLPRKDSIASLLIRRWMAGEL